MAALALDSHGPRILQNRIYFLYSTIYTYPIITIYKVMYSLLLFMEKNYDYEPNC